MAQATQTRATLWPGLPRLRSATAYLIALLGVEKQAVIIALLALRHRRGASPAAWLGLLDGVSRSFADHEDALGVFGIVARARGRRRVSTKTISCCCW